LGAGFVNYFTRVKSDRFQLRLQSLRYLTWQSPEHMVSS
jgi:hypothetical protein